MKKILLSIGILVAYASHAQVGNLTLNITELKSTKGNVLINLYRSEEGFPIDEKKAWKSANVPVTATTVTHLFENIPFDTYAITIAHDENGNGQLDINFMGILKEGTGTSNNAKGNFGPPKFADAKFNHAKPTTPINIKLTY
jgi:uncharacterized protein (DUF2141 family)